jgi:hypothetical protein
MLLYHLKKDNPDDELLSELQSMTEDALFLLSHYSFQLSVARRYSLKHLQRPMQENSELFGSELTKVCKHISETSRATSKMLKSSSMSNKNSCSNSFCDNNSFRPSRKQSSNNKSYSKNYQGHRWNPNHRNLSNKSSTAKNNKPHSTTVIVKIKGKPRSLFCNKRTVIGKLMHIIIYNENKYVEFICENKDVLVNFTS